MMKIPQRVIKHFRNASKGQSFVELALVVPILLLILMGLVEVAFFMGRYLDALDLTREAARFASVRDYRETSGDTNCSNPDDLNFYYDTSCIFSPPTDSGLCTDSDFCNGFNPFIMMDPEFDDVVISVFTVTNHTVSHTWPAVNGWALSNNDSDAVHSNNWQRNCDGDNVRATPYFTAARINNLLNSSASANKGLVAVEVYYCYEQALGLPLFTDIVPNPVQIHAYSLMPLPEAQPTQTPMP